MGLSVSRNSTDREYMLAKIGLAWGRCPELRLCQLIVNATRSNDPFYIEDDKLAAALDAYPPEAS